ncbi:MAG TPA: glycerol-3-phosphate 1-O-acyltransferase PlsY [Cytophagales bacterium]|nr:glycerol-3-phosphate 1-O-acyltransferase PlsY [Cytophagales bacterium]
MDITLIIFGALLAYLIGSIPTAVWYARRFHHIEIREHGSGNAGATNTFRVLGAKSGVIVLIIDILKGWIATRVANIPYWLDAISENDIVVYKLIFGLIAVIGHVFPVYENFKGGKGVATLLGMVMAIQLNVALACLGIFLIVFFSSKYVSLGSMLAALAYPILLLTKFVPQNHPELMTGFGVVMFLLVVLTHRKNVKRLLKGEESKIYLGRSKPQ